MPKFVVPYTLQGHMVIEADNEEEAATRMEFKSDLDLIAGLDRNEGGIEEDALYVMTDEIKEVGES